MKRFFILLVLLMALPGTAFAQCSDVQWVYGQAGTLGFGLYDGADRVDNCSLISGSEIQVNFDGTDDNLDTTTVTDQGLGCEISISSTEASPTNLEYTQVLFTDAATDFDDFCINLNVRLTAPTSTLQSATSTTAVLAASEAYADDLLNGNSEICIVSGTGANQCRCVTDTVLSTDTVTVRRAWTTTPDSTSTYYVRGNPVCAGVPAYSLESQAQTDVNSEVDDVLSTDVSSALSVCPSDTADMRTALTYLYERFRNKTTQASSGDQTLFQGDASTTLCTYAGSDDGTTFTLGEAAGP